MGTTMMYCVKKFAVCILCRAAKSGKLDRKWLKKFPSDTVGAMVNYFLMHFDGRSGLDYFCSL